VKESLRQPANRQAAISYYRDPASATAPGDAVPYAAEEHAASLQGSQPTLYLHGSADATSLWSWLVAPSRCSRPARV
jgi:hypothetical protein